MGSCGRGGDTVLCGWQEASVVLSARRAEEVTQEGLRRALAQMAPTALARSGVTPTQDTQELVVSWGG